MGETGNTKQTCPNRTTGFGRTRILDCTFRCPEVGEYPWLGTPSRLPAQLGAMNVIDIRRSQRPSKGVLIKMRVETFCFPPDGGRPTWVPVDDGAQQAEQQTKPSKPSAQQADQPRKGSLSDPSNPPQHFLPPSSGERGGRGVSTQPCPLSLLLLYGFARTSTM